VHLTPAAEERLGGPAWLDVAGLEALVDGLLPLYREPSRHSAQLALSGRSRA
jgi:ribosomal protein S12 methylthiotransferase accessory factor